MINEALKKLLDDYHVDRDFSKEVREGYRNPLEDSINNFFENKPNYRYGGSLAKGTANTNSCDIDLLCYFDSDFEMSVENIYESIAKSLEKSNYIYEKKNSAICVTGKIGEPLWDTSVDVVPGKYTSNDNKDVFLWCNKDKKRLKSNPELQINKVRESNYKNLIRIIKLFRTTHNFKFKSFYLEIFIIDYISKMFKENFTLYDELVIFCEHYNDIGNITLFDPANSANNISNIHSEIEFENIRTYIKTLYDAVLTNDCETILNCILNKEYNIEKAYLQNAKQHSPELCLSNNLITYTGISVKGKYNNNGIWYEFNSLSILSKELSLSFEIDIPSSFSIKEVKLIVTNSGYDASVRHNCPRGKAENTILQNTSYGHKFTRSETTSYYGNHFVQALLITTRGQKFYSEILTVRVR